MSTPLQPQYIEPYENAPAAPEETYRPVSALAVASLGFGLLSILVVLDWSLAAIPAVGIVLGTLALRRCRRASGELTGAALARAGVAISAALWILGYGWLAYGRAKEVPHGYTAVSYSELVPDPDIPGQKIPSAVFKLEGQKIFVKGYMYPGRQQSGIKQFLISRDNGSCPFCMPNPGPTDLIQVTLAGDLETEYTTRLLRLGGKFHVEQKALDSPWGGVAYRLEADYLK